MLIALVGPPQAGKHSVAHYLVHRHGFRLARIGVADSSSDASSDGPQDSAGDLHFTSASHLLSYATRRWRDRVVTVDVASVHDLAHGFAKRPFFLLVAIEAPLTVRFQRSRRTAYSAQAPSLAEFAQTDDEILYGHVTSNSAASGPSALPPANGNAAHQPSMTHSASTTPGVSLLDDPLFNPSAQGGSSATNGGNGKAKQHEGQDVHLGMGSLAIASASGSQAGLYTLLAQAHLRILNPYGDIDTLWSHLDTLDLASGHRLRPSWETYFLSLCTLASLRSNCMKRRVGAVLVRDNRVLSTGYNGTPRGLTNCNEGGCPRCNDSGAACGVGLDECLCLHAEENALLECGRERGGAQGTVLYCNTCPCLRCAVKIVQVGVKEVVYQLDYSVDHRSSDIFEAAGILCRKYVGDR